MEVYDSMDTLTNKQLKELCKQRKIKYYNRMNKSEMIEMLLKNDQDPTYVLDPKIKEKNFKYYKKWTTKNDEKHHEKQKKYQRKFWLKKFIEEGLISKDDVNEDIS